MERNYTDDEIMDLSDWLYGNSDSLDTMVKSLFGIQAPELTQADRDFLFEEIDSCPNCGTWNEPGFLTEYEGNPMCYDCKEEASQYDED